MCWVYEDIARAIQDCGLTLKEGSQEYHDFARRVVQKRIEAEQIAIARAKGDIVGRKKQLLDALLPPLPVPIKAPEPKTSPKLSEIFDKWKTEHLGASGPAKTVGEFWTQVERVHRSFRRPACPRNHARTGPRIQGLHAPLPQTSQERR